MKRSRRRKQKLPVEAVELTIERLSHDGRGIARMKEGREEKEEQEGKIAFVDGALAGERVSAVYTSRRNNYNELKATEVHEVSPERVEPACAYAGVCGGCSMQHISADAQRALKQSVLEEQLKHAGGLTEFERLAPIAGTGSGYRRKARLAARYVHKKGDVLVGFREKNSSFITDMDYCSVLVKEVADLIAPLRRLIMEMENRSSTPQVEVAVGETPDAGYQVALTVRHLEPLSAADLERFLSFARTHGVELYLQPKGPETVHKVWPENGLDRLHYYLPDFGLTMAFHPTDFTQVNGEINGLMVARAVELLELTREDSVLDLFCGLGNFTLPMATRCARVTGVEGSHEMVLRGSENAELNGIDNVSFYAADLTQDMHQQDWAQQAYSKILLDPPRSGAIEIIRQVADFKAERIVYISCNPATLARDAGELVKHGYTLKKAGILDMFPNTSHVESIALFERVS